MEIGRCARKERRNMVFSKMFMKLFTSTIYRLVGRWRWWKELGVSGEWDGAARAHAEQGWGWLMGMN